MNDDVAISFESMVPRLAEFLNIEESEIEGFYDALQSDRAFLDGINEKIAGVSEFGDKVFEHVDELRVFRIMLYCVVRAVRPTVMIETGVLNGFGSAFTLLAMAHNDHGTLYAIDIPPDDPRMAGQGTNPLPEGKGPGWLIPDTLRSRHQLRLGGSEVLLPQLLAEIDRLDVFLHDSDHCYTHMMFEMTMAWKYLRAGGILLCDNVEQNAGFSDLARAVKGQHVILQSFASASRRWEHGLMMRNQSD